MNPSVSKILLTPLLLNQWFCANPQPPAPAETFCNVENIVIIVPPESMNLKCMLPFRLFDHMTEQQDKNIVSSNVYGANYKLIIIVFRIEIKEGDNYG